MVSRTIAVAAPRSRLRMKTSVAVGGSTNARKAGDVRRRPHVKRQSGCCDETCNGMCHGYAATVPRPQQSSRNKQQKRKTSLERGSESINIVAVRNLPLPPGRRRGRGVAHPPSLPGLSLTLTRLATAPEAQLVGQSIVSESSVSRSVGDPFTRCRPVSRLHLPHIFRNAVKGTRNRRAWTVVSGPAQEATKKTITLAFGPAMCAFGGIIAVRACGPA
jgi:hypothetical protein